MLCGSPVNARHDHQDVSAVFPKDLATGAAGSRGRLRRGDHGDGGEVALSSRQSRKECDALGADGESVSTVLDVTALVDLLASSSKRGSHRVLGERRN